MARPRPASGLSFTAVSAERISDVISRLILALGVAFVIAIPARLLLDPATFAPVNVADFTRFYAVDEHGFIGAALMQIETHLGAFPNFLVLIGERLGSSLYWILATVALYCGAVSVVLSALHRDADLSPAVRRAATGVLLCTLFLSSNWGTFANAMTFWVSLNVTLAIFTFQSLALVASADVETAPRHCFIVVLCLVLAVETGLAGLFFWTTLIFIAFVTRLPLRVIVPMMTVGGVFLVASYARFNWFPGGTIWSFDSDPVHAVISVAVVVGSLFAALFFFEPLASISAEVGIVTGFVGICAAAYVLLRALVRRDLRRRGEILWIGLLGYSMQWMVAVAARHMPPDSWLLSVPARFNLPTAVFWMALFALAAQFVGRMPERPALGTAYVATVAGVGLLMALFQLHAVFIQ